MPLIGDDEKNRAKGGVRCKPSLALLWSIAKRP